MLPPGLCCEAVKHTYYMAVEDTTGVPPGVVLHFRGCSLEFQTPIACQIPVSHHPVSSSAEPLSLAGHQLPTITVHYV